MKQHRKANCNTLQKVIIDGKLGRGLNGRENLLLQQTGGNVKPIDLMTIFKCGLCKSMRPLQFLMGKPLIFYFAFRTSSVQTSQSFQFLHEERETVEPTFEGNV